MIDQDQSERGRNTASNRLPPWFKIRLATNGLSTKVRNEISRQRLHTVCRSAACPNQAECWSSGTATFLILGNVCTRGCRFCNVPKGNPQGLDRDEPQRVADAVKALNLTYAVVTSVTRDDLADGGASQFALTIRSIRAAAPGCGVEVLIPDLQGSRTSLDIVLSESPDVLNHNLETVPALYQRVRPKAVYLRSLELLRRAAEQGAPTKSGLMLGLGESLDQVREVLRDLRTVGCSILTLGQYLRPGKNHLPVERYVHPDEFYALRQEASDMGFAHVAAGPLVRSSYHAGEYEAEGIKR